MRAPRPPAAASISCRETATRRPARCRQATHNNLSSGKLSLLFLVCLFFPTNVSAQLKHTRRVLILNDLGSRSSGVATINHEIFATLERLPYHIEFYTENLDANLFEDETSQRQFRDWYSHKYTDRKPDLIIAVGQSPLELMPHSPHVFPPTTPILSSRIP